MFESKKAKQKRAVDVGQGLYTGGIEKAIESGETCNVEYVNEQTGDVVVVSGCTPLHADSKKYSNLLIGVGVPMGKRPEFSKPTRAWIK